MRTLAPPLATLVVLVVAFTAVFAVDGVLRWGRWLVASSSVVGTVGLVLTSVAFLNLLVPRPCAGSEGDREVNRPIVSLVLGSGDCFRASLGQAGLSLLTGVLASAVVTARRRATPKDVAAGGATAARYR